MGESLVIGEDGGTITEEPLRERYYQYVYVVQDIFGNTFASKPAFFEMVVSPEDLMDEDVVLDRAYAADVRSIGGEPIALGDDEASQQTDE